MGSVTIRDRAVSCDWLQARELEGHFSEQAMELSKQIVRPLSLIEDGLGFFFTNLLTLPIGMTVLACFDWKDSNIHVLWRVAIGIIAIAWIFLDIPFLFRFWRAILRGPRPATLTAALNQPRVPTIVRPLVGAWWLAHFGAGVAIAIAMHGVKPAQPGGERAVRIVGDSWQLHSDSRQMDIFFRQFAR